MLKSVLPKLISGFLRFHKINIFKKSTTRQYIVLQIIILHLLSQNYIQVCRRRASCAGITGNMRGLKLLLSWRYHNNVENDSLTCFSSAPQLAEAVLESCHSQKSVSRESQQKLGKEACDVVCDLGENQCAQETHNLARSEMN